MKMTYQTLLAAAQQLNEDEREQLIKDLLKTIGHNRKQSILGKPEKNVQTTEEMMDFIQKDNIF